MKKIFGLFAAVSLFVACGGEDNPSSAEPCCSDIPAVSSSSSVVLPPMSQGILSSGNENPLVSSSSADIPVNPPVVQGDYPDEPLYFIDPALAVTADADGFYDIADIYKAAPKTSKIAFVIRHSARMDSTSQACPLTQDGAAAAKALGERIGGEEAFYYASTDFVRTRETAANIAAGRGETPVVEILQILDGNYFYRDDAVMDIESLKKKAGNLNAIVSRYSYGMPFTTDEKTALVYSCFYPFFARGNQFIKEVILDNIDKWKRVSILVSHDVLLEPMAVYASNRTVDLRSYENSRWVNFMSGVAVVVNETGAVSVFPVRGYDAGWQDPKTAKEEAQAATAATPLL